MTAEYLFLLLVDGIFIKIHRILNPWNESQKWKDMKSCGRCSLKIMELNYESVRASLGGWVYARERRCGPGLKLWGILVWWLQGSSQGQSQRKDQWEAEKRSPGGKGGRDAQETTVLDIEKTNDIRIEANPLGLETLRLLVTWVRATDGEWGS